MARLKCLIEETIFKNLLFNQENTDLRQRQALPPTAHPRKKKEERNKYVIYLGFLNSKLLTADSNSVL